MNITEKRLPCIAGIDHWQPSAARNTPTSLDPSPHPNPNINPIRVPRAPKRKNAVPVFIAPVSPDSGSGVSNHSSLVSSPLARSPPIDGPGNTGVNENVNVNVNRHSPTHLAEVHTQDVDADAPRGESPKPTVSMDVLQRALGTISLTPSAPMHEKIVEDKENPQPPHSPPPSPALSPSTSVTSHPAYIAPFLPPHSSSFSPRGGGGGGGKGPRKERGNGTERGMERGTGRGVSALFNQQSTDDLTYPIVTNHFESRGRNRELRIINGNKVFGVEDRYVPQMILSGPLSASPASMSSSPGSPVSPARRASRSGSRSRSSDRLSPVGEEAGEGGEGLSPVTETRSEGSEFSEGMGMGGMLLGYEDEFEDDYSFGDEEGWDEEDSDLSQYI